MTKKVLQCERPIFRSDTVEHVDKQHSVKRLRDGKLLNGLLVHRYERILLLGSSEHLLRDIDAYNSGAGSEYEIPMLPGSATNIEDPTVLIERGSDDLEEFAMGFSNMGESEVIVGRVDAVVATFNLVPLFEKPRLSVLVNGHVCPFASPVPPVATNAYCRTMRNAMGIVLAGGESTRMGRDKAEVLLASGTMAEIVAKSMTEVFDTTVVVGRKRCLAGLETIPDIHDAHQGPLSGLLTALTAFETSVVLVAVDQPLVRIDTLRRLGEMAANDTTALCIDELPQVTCAAYSYDCLDEAARQLEAGGSIQRMLTAVPHARIERQTWSQWGEDGRSWFSCDTPDDIVEAERRFRVDLLST